MPLEITEPSDDRGGEYTGLHQSKRLDLSRIAVAALEMISG